MTTTAVPARAAGRGPAHVAGIGWERGKLEVKEFFRQRESVVFTVAFPVILLLLFTPLFRFTTAGGIQFSRYFVPGVLAVGMFGVCFQTVAIQIAIERDKGILKRLQGTPMPPGSYFLGKIVMVLALVVIESALLLAIASALGNVTLPADWHKWVTFAWVTIAGAAAGTLLGIAFSSVPRSGRAAPATITPVALVLQFISGVYFVFTGAPAWLQYLGALFPLKWIAQGYRSVFLPDGFAAQEPAHHWEHGRMALILVLWAVGGLLLTLRTFRWRSSRDT
jgi:ABC-2 type transport system permease protein